MKLMSYIEENNELIPIEVELELWPGLPDIHFLGLPDTHLRESAKRIKSAIKAQGFEFPVSQQILVNLKPSYLRKSSRGLELAVAVAFLQATGQISLPVSSETLFFYGELSLVGEVSPPNGLLWMKKPSNGFVVTGTCKELWPFSRYHINNLQDLAKLTLTAKDIINWQEVRSEEILNLKISEELADILAVISLGQHRAMFAGASGAGKTTAAKILHALMPELNESERLELLYITQAKNGFVVSRPFIQPHHQVPLNSLIGGGSQAHGGELARSHLGILLLDEFLEFQSRVMESMREPLEHKIIRVPRGNRVKEYPLNTQLIATTNLCPCGDYVPGMKKKKSCRFSLQKCHSYSQRFSGPLLDRFEALIFFSEQASTIKSISVSEVLTRLNDVRSLATANDIKLVDEKISKIKEDCDSFWFKREFEEVVCSERRKIATLRLARSYCLWRKDDMITAKHFAWAIKYSRLNFEKIKLWDC